MKNWSDLKSVLTKKGIPEADQRLVSNFLRYFPFRKRQQLLNIFFGFQEKIELFIDLIKRKKELAEMPNAALSKEILNSEEKEIDSLANELK